MIAYFFEGEQYLTYIQEKLGIQMINKEVETPYGKQKILIDNADSVIWFYNAGHYKNMADADVPRSVAYIMQIMNVSGFVMISKVGGINKLLNVGDVMIMDDYIDRTSIYDFSYKNNLMEEIPRYDMSDPFSEEWRESVFNKLVKDNIIKSNIYNRGIYICTNGPGFESKAEIGWYKMIGADVVGHYLSPYIYYCRELGISCMAASIISNNYHTKDLLVDDDKTKDVICAIYKAAGEFNDHWKEETKEHWIRNL